MDRMRCECELKIPKSQSREASASDRHRSVRTGEAYSGSPCIDFEELRSISERSLFITARLRFAVLTLRPSARRGTGESRHCRPRRSCMIECAVGPLSGRRSRRWCGAAWPRSSARSPFILLERDGLVSLLGWFIRQNRAPRLASRFDDPAPAPRRARESCCSPRS